MKLIMPDKTDWEHMPSLMRAFNLEQKSSPIISVIGAGGKTSTIKQLAKEYEAHGKKVIVTTTTKMYQPTKQAWCREESLEIVDNYLCSEAILWIGLLGEEGKMIAPNLQFLKQLTKLGFPMLIEADGARKLPFKLPGKTEPVILETTQIVIAVLGMTAWNKSWKEVCFRYELASEYLQKKEDKLITEEDYVDVIQSRFGLKKGVSDKMEYIVILNQADSEELVNHAINIRNMLQKNGIRKVYLTSYFS